MTHCIKVCLEVNINDFVFIANYCIRDSEYCLMRCSASGDTQMSLPESQLQRSVQE